MVQTRIGLKAVAETDDELWNEENGEALSKNTMETLSQTSTKRVAKRRASVYTENGLTKKVKHKTQAATATASETTSTQPTTANESNTDSKSTTTNIKVNTEKANNTPTHESENKGEAEVKRRLTTPDIEFDYDRSQLRDPRATPGRSRRPRHTEHDIPETEKQELLTRFYIAEAPKPKGRLNASQKDALFTQNSLLNPLAVFHDSNICLKKGPSGSPTYDSAGFLLDWRKVDDSCNPKRSYTKSSVVNGMERAIDKAQKEEKQIFQTFFVDGKPPKAKIDHQVKNYVKDQISKDIGVPWHQIGSSEARKWAEQGFEKVIADDWWREPNKEEDRRMMKMMTGARHRKGL